MACDNRQLTQAQREAGYNQQRTGVPRAIRPFSGAPTLENLLDYLNRELVPAVQQTRGAVNDVFLQVADQAPSANPLAYYFSTNVAASDPTSGFVKLNQATQNTASFIRVSQSNARLQDVTPWLDVMSGGPTTPLGTVTLIDSINPGRFLRFDLNTMTDQGAYWDLGVTFIEGSHESPFVEDEAVVLAFISGVSAAGSTVPVGSLSPVATDTFIGNISGSTVAPSAVPLADVDSTSIVYDGTSHTFQRAAMTGFATASQNGNATSSAEPIITYSASANMSAERVLTSSTSNTISTAVASQVAVERAALTGAISAAANSNGTLFAGIRDNGAAESDRANLNFVNDGDNSIELTVTDDAGNDELEIRAQYVGSTTNVNLTSVTGSQGVIDISTLRCGGSVTIESVTGDYTVDGFTAKSNGFWFWYFDRRQSGSAVGTFNEDAGSTTTSIRNQDEVETVIPFAGRALLYYQNTRWRVASAGQSGRLLRVTTYTSGSGTHTFMRTCRHAIVRMKGGGGGGGGAGDSDGNVGAGGGEGGYEELSITDVPASSAYSVGAAGSAGAASPDPGTAGGSGGDTTFHDGSTTRTAGGGSGGGVGGVLGDPGNGGSVDSIGGTVVYSRRGAPGHFGMLISATAEAHGGNGGGSGAGEGGFGGSGGTSSEAGQAAGANSGAGGGGGSRPASPAVAGGAGAAGYIIVDEFT